MFNLRSVCFQITIFERAKNHGKKSQISGQTSFSEIFYYIMRVGFHYAIRIVEIREIIEIRGEIIQTAR